MAAACDDHGQSVVVTGPRSIACACFLPAESARVIHGWPQLPAWFSEGEKPHGEPRRLAAHRPLPGPAGRAHPVIWQHRSQVIRPEARRSHWTHMGAPAPGKSAGRRIFGACSAPAADHLSCLGGIGRRVTAPATHRATCAAGGGGPLNQRWRQVQQPQLPCRQARQLSRCKTGPHALRNRPLSMRAAPAHRDVLTGQMRRNLRPCRAFEGPVEGLDPSARIATSAG